MKGVKSTSPPFARKTFVRRYQHAEPTHNQQLDMRNLYAESPELVRHLSRIAADVWGCAPYEDDGGTRWPLAMPLMGIVTAFHPSDSTHAVQLATPLDSIGTDANPPARLLHDMRDMTAPLPWRHACERAHALACAACPLPLPASRPPEDSEIVFGHYMQDHWALDDGDGIRITLMRFMNEDAEPVTDAPFWNVVVWLDERPILNQEVEHWHALNAYEEAVRLWHIFEGASEPLRAMVSAYGWAETVRRFKEAYGE